MTCLVDQMRIGGEFEFLADDFVEEKTRLLGPSSRHLIWTDTGRSALYLIAEAIQYMGGNKRIWLPAYCCASISQAFRQANYTISYYPSSDLIGTAACLPQPSIGDSLLFVHYFGHANTVMLDAIDQYKASGITVIEDFVQAGLNSDMQLHGDFGVTSYRKLLPVPDGAALLSQGVIDTRPIVGLPLAKPDDAFVSSKLAGKALRAQGAAAADFLPLLESAESFLESKIIPRERSHIARWMLDRLDLSRIRACRRANWLQLEALITPLVENGRLRPLMPVLAKADVPLSFPIIVSRALRNRLRSFLGAKNIYCPVHWSLDFLPGHFSAEVELSASILSLPVDQRMTTTHVEYMVDSIVEFFTEAK